VIVKVIGLVTRDTCTCVFVKENKNSYAAMRERNKKDMKRPSPSETVMLKNRRGRKRKESRETEMKRMLVMHEERKRSPGNVQRKQASKQERQNTPIHFLRGRRTQTPTQTKTPQVTTQTVEKEEQKTDMEEERHEEPQKRSRETNHRTLLLINSMTLTAGPRLEVLDCHDPVLPVGLPGESSKMYSPST
jgi:hypothetical protein